MANEKISSGSRNKQGNKQGNPINTFLGASQGEQDKGNATPASAEPALRSALTQMEMFFIWAYFLSPGPHSDSLLELTSLVLA